MNQDYKYPVAVVHVSVLTSLNEIPNQLNNVPPFLNPITSMPPFDM